MDKFTIVKDIHLFAKKLLFKVKFNKDCQPTETSSYSIDEFDFPSYTTLDFQILRDLTELLWESDLDEVDLIDQLGLEELPQVEDTDEISKKCRNKSKTTVKTNPMLRQRGK